MLKLLAYFDEATVLLYFAQSVFGKNKHKPIVSWAEEENQWWQRGTSMLNRTWTEDIYLAVL